MLGCVLASGCNQRAAKQAELEQDRKRVSADSTHDASQAVVDEARRFRLENPGDGWKTVGEADARKINPDFVAMTFNTQARLNGSVIVEYLPGMSLDAYVDLSLAVLEPGVEVGLREPTRFQDHDAIRLKVTTMAGGLKSHHEMLAIARGDYFYRVDAWTSTDGPANFQPIFEAFSLLDGEVTHTAAATPTADGHGLGWMVRDGVFRSVDSGVEIAGGGGPRLVVGSELVAMDPKAEVGFMGGNPSMFATLSVSPWDLGSLTEARAAQAEAVVSGYPDAHQLAALELTIAGAKVPMDTWIEGPMRYYYGLFDLGEQRLALLAWWTPALDEINRPALIELGKQVRALDPAAREALAAELSQLPDPQQAIGPTWTIHGSVYLDFVHQLRWTKPRAGALSWSFVTDAQATEIDPDATVAIRDRQTGRNAAIAHFPGAGALDDEGWRQHIATTWPGVVEQRRTSITLDALPAELIYGEVTDRGHRWPAYLVAQRRGNDGVVVFYGSPNGDDASERPQLDALLAGIDFDESITDLEQSNGRFIDHRMGVSLQVPSHWSSSDQTPPEISALARGTGWSAAGKEMMMLLTMHPPQLGQDLAWIEGFMEQLARDAFGVNTKDVAERSDVTIAGRAGRRLAWSKPVVTVSIVRNGGTYYMFMATGASATEMNGVLDSVEFVE